MNKILKLCLYKMWDKSVGPGNLYVLFFIFTLMMAYTSFFPFLVEIFGTTTRVFPAIYLAIAAISWGFRGAISVTILNVVLNFVLYKYTGHAYEGGILGPAGCLFATSLVGIISDLAKQLDQQLQQHLATEDVLKNSEIRYRRIFDMASDAILLIDCETEKIIEANSAASKIYGYNHDEFFQKRLVDISAQPDDPRAAIIEQEKHVLLRYHKKKSGNIFPAEITAEYFIMQDRRVYVIAIRDISLRLKSEEEKRRLETQFFQAQKMESIGTLAGGISHDFNNLLGGILGHASLGLMKIAPEDPTIEHLKVIEKLAKSGGNLTKHILGFARGGKYEVKTTDFNELISHHSFVFGRTHKHINIVENIGDNLWHIDADKGQIEQVFFNIYINAVQAMPGKGTIFVSAENTIIQDATAFPFSVKPGEYIKVSVRDTGKGMDELTRERIFEPFFSTKEKGVGTGLGMAAVYGIIKNHGGYIHVVSQFGDGTTIIILLPRSEKKCKMDKKSQIVSLIMGAGTLLVVDDEEEMLNVAKDMIEVMGYDVLTANSGNSAISLFREKNKEIDLVLLDMIMPDMDGTETFNRLKEINKDVKVLFQTGYSLDRIKIVEFDKGCAGVIQKPFSINTLSHKIKKALDSSREILITKNAVAV